MCIEILRAPCPVSQVCPGVWRFQNNSVIGVRGGLMLFFSSLKILTVVALRLKCIKLVKH